MGIYTQINWNWGGWEKLMRRGMGWIGLLAGLAVGTFSRTLTFLFGLVVLGVQVCFMLCYYMFGKGGRSQETDMFLF